MENGFFTLFLSDNLQISLNLVQTHYIQLESIQLPLFPNTMHSSSVQEKSDLVSYDSKRQTKLSRFLTSITPSLLAEMQKFLEKNQLLFSVKEHQNHKISMYEDVMAIVMLKQNEDQLFREKGKLRKTIEQISDKIKRKYATVEDRLKRKICLLTPEQLIYIVQSKKDIIFKGNSRVLNTDDWPEHLRVYESQQNRSVSGINDSQSVIHVESSSQARRSASLYGRNSRQKEKEVSEFKRRLKSKRKEKRTSVIEGVVMIMQEPQGPNDVNDRREEIARDKNPREENLRHIPKGQETISKLYDLSNVIQRGLFSQEVIGQWRQNNLIKHWIPTEKTMIQSKICYNFMRREYTFINPEVLRSVWNSLKQEELRQVIRSRRVENEQKKQKDEMQGQWQIYEELQQQQKVERQLSSKRKEKRQQEVNKLSKQAQLNHSYQNSNKLNQTDTKVSRKKLLTLNNERNRNPHQQNQHRNSSNIIQNPLIQLQGQQLNNEEHKQTKTFQPLIKNPIQLLQEIASKCDITQLPQEMKLFLQKGLQLSAQIKNHPSSASLQNPPQQQRINLISSQQDEELSQSLPQQYHRTMLYWFNNDQNLYQTYQQDPYIKGHLMWCQEEDDLLRRTNVYFEQNLQEFQLFMKYKQPENVWTRIKFLDINLTDEMERYIKVL